MLHLLLFQMLQKNMPALAGIRVMLIALAVLDCRKIAACISRYSCNVTNLDGCAVSFLIACISRYSCNVT